MPNAYSYWLSRKILICTSGCGVVRIIRENPIPGSSLKGNPLYVERILKSEVYKDFKSCLIVNDPCILEKILRK